MPLKYKKGILEILTGLEAGVSQVGGVLSSNDLEA